MMEFDDPPQNSIKTEDYLIGPAFNYHHDINSSICYPIQVAYNTYIALANRQVGDKILVLTNKCGFA